MFHRQFGENGCHRGHAGLNLAQEPILDGRLHRALGLRDNWRMQERATDRPAASRRYAYECVTRGIRVSVKPAFVEDQSDPEQGHFLWSYAITIENRGGETVQLMSRYWHITDALGRAQEVHGPGVVGAQPVLEPGQSFKYASGCPLPTPSGAMSGRYQMRSASGEDFEVDIPAFLLESPYERRQIH